MVGNSNSRASLSQGVAAWARQTRKAKVAIITLSFSVEPG
jgi:hypothetical protein